MQLAQLGVMRMKSLIDQINFAVLVIDENDFNIEVMNDAAREWFGDVIGKYFFLIFQSINEELLKKRVLRGKTYNQECSISEPDSVRMRYLSVTAKKLHHGEFLHHFLVQCSDISRVREQEKILESYTAIIQKQMHEIELSHKKNADLLLNILPKKVMDELLERGSTSPQTFQNVTIMFVDFVNFTQMDVSSVPSLLFSELNDIYTHFDDIAELHQCERIKTIGDTYLAVCGLPMENPDHATNVARLAKGIISYLEIRNSQHPIKWYCRIGIHTGSVIGGVVGIKKYIYDVFGDSINTASRMQTHSEPMKITISGATRRLIDNTEFQVASRGRQEVKGKGEMELFFLEL